MDLRDIKITKPSPFCHGDLKPENIMLYKSSTGTPTFRLLDPVSNSRITSFLYHPRLIIGSTGDLICILLTVTETLTRERVFLRSSNSPVFDCGYDPPQSLIRSWEQKYGHLRQIKDIANLFLKTKLKEWNHNCVIEMLEKWRKSGDKVSISVPKLIWDKCEDIQL
jgi:hypothetical protein